jgi:hypothetical protein
MLSISWLTGCAAGGYGVYALITFGKRGGLALMTSRTFSLKFFLRHAGRNGIF